MNTTPAQVRQQFFKTLQTCTGSESLRRDCEDLYQLGRRGFPRSYPRLPLFNIQTANTEKLRGDKVKMYEIEIIIDEHGEIIITTPDDDHSDGESLIRLTMEQADFVADHLKSLQPRPKNT